MRIVLPIIILLTLSACATKLPSEHAAKAVEISDGIYFSLLPAKLFGQDLSITQLVDVSYTDQQHSFIVQMEIDHSQNSLKLIGLTRFGVKVFDLVYQTGKIQYWAHDNVPDNFSPSFLLADIQLALWSMKDLKNNLTGKDIQFIEQPETPVKRVLSSMQGDILRIKFDKNANGLDTLHYQHLSRQYTIRVDTLSIEAL